ncbi:MAG: hypothetical protein VSS75_034595 [Candidatus Parabeggiatoa sp.]|nr:hypothetical protein [Candidatus Parabeggiatoa sp.]
MPRVSVFASRLCFCLASKHRIIENAISFCPDDVCITPWNKY